MRHFAEQMSAGPLNQFLLPFAKKDAVLEESFVLKNLLTRGWQSITQIDQGHFYLDGNFSFALGYKRGKKQKPLWIAVASIATGKISKEYQSALVNRGVETNYDPQLPLVVQLQGPSRWSYTSDRHLPQAKKVLRKFKWERSLVALVLDWAERNNVPSVHLVPSELVQQMNITEPTDEDEPDKTENRRRLKEAERLYMRYNVTAKRMGFKRQGEGFFKKEIRQEIA